MRGRMLGLMGAVFLCLALCTSALALERMEGEMGYDGAVTYLRTIPVTVRLTGGERDESGMLRVDVQCGANEYDRYQVAVTVAAGATVRTTLPVVLSMREAQYTVEWVVDGEVRASLTLTPRRSIDPTTLIVGVLSETPERLSFFNLTRASDVLRRREYWQTLPLTAETFPSDAEGMSAFDMLVVDGFDASLLTDAQKAVLDGWLRKGGIVFLGGGTQAAETFPFFESYTGIRAGAIQSDVDVTASLGRALSIGDAPLGQTVPTASLQSASGTSFAGGLVDVTTAGTGHIYTAAFALGDAALSQWQGDQALWQRILLETAATRYQAMVDTRAELYQYADYYDVSLPVDNGSGMALPIVLLGLFVLLVGFGAYAVLKKLDQQSLMWVTTPVLAVVFSLLMWLMSGTLGLRDPIVTSLLRIQLTENGEQNTEVEIAVSRADTGRLRVSSTAGTLEAAGSSYYYDDRSATSDAPTILRNERTYGAANELSIRGGYAPWQSLHLQMNGLQVSGVQVSGVARYDGDDMLVDITNEGDIPLENGLLISSCGIARVDTILPAQTATVRLKAVPTPKGAAAYEVKEGVLFTTEQRSNNSPYQFVDAFSAVQGSDAHDGAPWEEVRSLLYNESFMRWDTRKMNFRFVATMGELLPLGMEVDGQPATRTAQRTVLMAELRYDPVATDGSTLHFLPDTFSTYEASLGEADKPVKGEPLTLAYQDHQLALEPVFGFDISAAPKGMRVTGFDIGIRYDYGTYTAYLYNVQTGEWDEAKVRQRDSSGMYTDQRLIVALGDYIDESGMVYMRCVPLDGSYEGETISTPMIELEGVIL